jgi:hypothetical protein
MPLAYETREPLTIPGSAFNADDVATILVQGAACGRWSKHITLTAANVACEKCLATWDFAIAERESPGPKTGSDDRAVK